MKKIFSKKAAYLPSIIFVTMLVTIAVCCDPPSLVGRSALIRLAVTIPLNILFQILLYLLAAALLFIAFHYLLRERSIVKRRIADLILGIICILFCCTLITDSYLSPLRGSIKGDFRAWTDILSDLNGGDAVCIENLNIKTYRMPGHTSHRSAANDSYYIVAVDEYKNSFRFAITAKDMALIFGDDDYEPNYGKIEYYKKSGLVKAITLYDEVTAE